MVSFKEEPEGSYDSIYSQFFSVWLSLFPDMDVFSRSFPNACELGNTHL
jgi:hypothetical protein